MKCKSHLLQKYIKQTFLKTMKNDSQCWYETLMKHWKKRRLWSPLYKPCSMNKYFMSHHRWSFMFSDIFQCLCVLIVLMKLNKCWVKCDVIISLTQFSISTKKPKQIIKDWIFERFEDTRWVMFVTNFIWFLFVQFVFK